MKRGAVGASGVPHEAVLLAFAEAVVAHDDRELSRARSKLREELGDAAFVDTAGIVASFNSVVRIADATGIVMEPAKLERTVDLRRELGL
ncbi:MAG: hypothetical protein ACR2RL_26125 [Gammaproteobacteria bacterium]